MGGSISLSNTVTTCFLSLYTFKFHPQSIVCFVQCIGQIKIVFPRVVKCLAQRELASVQRSTLTRMMSKSGGCDFARSVRPGHRPHPSPPVRLPNPPSLSLIICKRDASERRRFTTLAYPAQDSGPTTARRANRSTLTDEIHAETRAPGETPYVLLENVGESLGVTWKRGILLGGVFFRVASSMLHANDYRTAWERQVRISEGPDPINTTEGAILAAIQVYRCRFLSVRRTLALTPDDRDPDSPFAKISSTLTNSPHARSSTTRSSTGRPGFVGHGCLASDSSPTRPHRVPDLHFWRIVGYNPLPSLRSLKYRVPCRVRFVRRDRGLVHLPSPATFSTAPPFSHNVLCDQEESKPSNSGHEDNFQPASPLKTGPSRCRHGARWHSSSLSGASTTGTLSSQGPPTGG